MSVLTARERSIFSCLADTVLAPAPPLPPVRETDAVASFEEWLARGSRLNRVALRALLLGLDLAPRLTRRRRPWRALQPPQRLAVLRRFERAGGGPAVEALRASAAVSYYGDPHVSALLGYVPGHGAPR